LRALQQQGHKKVVQAVRAAISEAGMTGAIQSLPRTKHGETRIPKDQRHVPADRVDLDSPDDLLALPLLRVLSADEWEHLGLSADATDVVRKISGSDYERDADGIMIRLDELAGWEKATFVESQNHYLVGASRSLGLISRCGSERSSKT
jgi:hypothetical protein